MQNDNLKFLAKWFANGKIPQQQDLLKKILEENPSLKQDYEFLNSIDNEFDTENIDRAQLKILWTSLQKRIENRQRKILIFNLLKYSFLFVLFLVSSLYIFLWKKDVVIVNRGKEPLSRVLPDGSTVILDTNSQIVYKIGLFSPFNRSVNFKGIAFFKIKQTSDRKHFIVHCPDLDIKVYGTEFNVAQKEKMTSIALIKGKIQLYNFSKNDTTLIMHTNDVIEYCRSSGRIIKKNVKPELYLYWMYNKIEFKNLSLEEISELIKYYYGKIVVFDNNQLTKKHIGGSAPSDDINLLLKAISLIINKKYVIHQDTVIFK